MIRLLAFLVLCLVVLTELADIGDGLGGSFAHSLVIGGLAVSIATVLVVTVIGCRKSWQETTPESRLGRWTLAELGVVVVLASSLRLVNLTGASYTGDETIHYALARLIPETFIPQMPSGLIYIRGFVFSYVTAVSTAVFGLNEFGLRIPSVAFGVLLVLVSFWLTKSLFSLKAGFAAAWFAALDIYMLAYSQLGRFYILLYLLMALAALSFYKCFVTGEWRPEVFAAVMTVGLFTQNLIAFLGPLLFGWWLLTHRSLADLRENAAATLYFVVPGVLFLIYFRLRASLFVESVPGERLTRISKPIFGFNIYNVDYYRELLINPYPVGWLLLVGVGALILSGAVALSDRQKLNAAYVGSIVLLYFVVLGFVVRRDALRFIIVVVPFLHVLFGAASSLWFDWLLKYLPERPDIKYVVRAAAVAVVLLNVVTGSVVVSYDNRIDTIPDEEESTVTMLSYHLSGEEYAFHTKSMHLAVWNYRDSAQYVSERVRQEDTVISSANFNPNYPYVAVDYSVNKYISSYLGYRVNGTRHELYRGIPVVTSRERIAEIYNRSGTTYVLAGPRLEPHTAPGVEKYIKKNSEVVYRSQVNDSPKTTLFGENKTIRVYKEVEE